MTGDAHARDASKVVGVSRKVIGGLELARGLVPEGRGEPGEALADGLSLLCDLASFEPGEEAARPLTAGPVVSMRRRDELRAVLIEGGRDGGGEGV